MSSGRTERGQTGRARTAAAERRDGGRQVGPAVGRAQGGDEPEAIEPRRTVPSLELDEREPSDEPALRVGDEVDRGRRPHRRPPPRDRPGRRRSHVDRPASPPSRPPTRRPRTVHPRDQGAAARIREAKDIRRGVAERRGVDVVDGRAVARRSQSPDQDGHAPAGRRFHPGGAGRCTGGAMCSRRSSVQHCRGDRPLPGSIAGLVRLRTWTTARRRSPLRSAANPPHDRRGCRPHPGAGGWPIAPPAPAGGGSSNGTSRTSTTPEPKRGGGIEVRVAEPGTEVEVVARAPHDVATMDVIAPYDVDAPEERVGRAQAAGVEDRDVEMAGDRSGEGHDPRRRWHERACRDRCRTPRPRLPAP